MGASLQALIARGVALLALPEDASAAAIDARRRELARALHPDLRGDDGGLEDLEAVYAAARAMKARSKVRRCVRMRATATGLEVTLDELCEFVVGR